MKPNTAVTVSWGASSAGSGSISGYTIRYTTNGGSTYTVVTTTNASTRSYTFTPSVIDGQTLIVQVRANNSYGKSSSYGSFTSIAIYTTGLSVGKISGSIKHLRGYVKVSNAMKKITSIKVKRGGTIYSIDQYTPPS